MKSDPFSCVECNINYVFFHPFRADFDPAIRLRFEPELEIWPNAPPQQQISSSRSERVNLKFRPKSQVQTQIASSDLNGPTPRATLVGRDLELEIGT